MARKERDPYAPPPMYHDRSGALVRIVIVGALVALAGFGYMTYGRNRTPEVAQLEPAQPQAVAPTQQLADASGTADLPPTPMPQAQTTQRAPAAAAPRRSAPRPPPAEPVPPPVTRIDPAPVEPTPTPISPVPDPATSPPQG